MGCKQFNFCQKKKQKLLLAILYNLMMAATMCSIDMKPIYKALLPMYIGLNAGENPMDLCV
jgi:hypothetical protein